MEFNHEGAQRIHQAPIFLSFFDLFAQTAQIKARQPCARLVIRPVFGYHL
jgi:hypothetical protein